MKAERWKQIDDLLDAVLDLPPDQRGAYLAAQCVGDDELKQEVLSLLQSEKQSDEFLEESALNLMAQQVARDPVETLSLIARQIASYKIEKLIGSGGMGEVYLAHDEKLERKVALKILPAEFVADPERVKRFEREARMISATNHPYIVTIHDFGSVDGLNYIATEFVDGETVRDLITHGIELKKTLNIISQTCEALAAAHKAGLIHRDIKPENIMVRPDGFVKVLDFGLAKLAGAEDVDGSLSNYTMKGVIIGTPAYMSPVQVAGEAVDHRTDLWSVGIVLYEMLAGVNPFKGESRQATFQNILSEEPPRISGLVKDVPAEIDSILSKALEKDPEVSYQTASDLLADLKRVRREIDSSPSLRSGTVTTGRAKGNEVRPKFAKAAFAVAVIAITGVAVWYFAFRVQRSDATDWSKATNIQLTSEEGTEYFPVLSPDGKSFVYASDAAGNFDIYVQRIGSKKANNLTENSTAVDTQPAISPDGDRIAFRSDREPKGIYVMGETGENPRLVADFGYQPSWSPDGREIVVSTFGLDAPNVRVGLDNGLWIVDVASGAKREILKAEATFPAWSPNGKRIAYWFYEVSVGRRDVATMPVDGGEPVVITKDFSNSNWNPVWSPDGKFLYFVSDKGGNVNFWRVAIDEMSGKALGEPEPIVTPSKYSRHLNFSRDGKRMIYVQTDNQSNIQGVEFDSDAGKAKSNWFWITRGDREIIRPELSPDGKQFVMRQTRRTRDDIVTVSRDGSTWSDVTNDEPYDRYPRWSPDSKQIAFTSDRNIGTEIWVSNADGSNPHQVTFQYTPTFASGFPTWSPDGKSLIYSNNGRPYIVDLTKTWEQQQGPQAVLSPEVEGGFTVWDWSPDGKKLIGLIPFNARIIAVYSFETGRLEHLVENVDTVPAWLADSRRFVYENENKIFIGDIETKKSVEVLIKDPQSPRMRIRSPFVSRDGKLLYYAVFNSESNIWLLDLTQTP